MLYRSHFSGCSADVILLILSPHSFISFAENVIWRRRAGDGGGGLQYAPETSSGEGETNRDRTNERATVDFASHLREFADSLPWETKRCRCLPMREGEEGKGHGNYTRIQNGRCCEDVFVSALRQQPSAYCILAYRKYLRRLHFVEGDRVILRCSAQR